MKAQQTNKLLNLANFNYHSDTFIETGSSMGAGIERALIAGYPIIRSVELDNFAYSHCVNRFTRFHPSQENWCKIHLYLGKSVERLAEMLAASPKRCVIMLDAHPAGPHTAGHEDLMAKGNASEFNQHNIIMNELKIILAHSKEHVIIIDDQNGFDQLAQEYAKYMLEHGEFEFYLYDEKLSKESPLRPNKLLVAVPAINEIPKDAA